MMAMKNDEGPVIDMTPEGEFIDPPAPKADIGMLVVRLVVFGLVLGVIGLMFWTVLLALPLLLLVGVVGYFAVRLPMFRPRPPGGF